MLDHVNRQHNVNVNDNYILPLAMKSKGMKRSGNSGVGGVQGGGAFSDVAGGGVMFHSFILNRFQQYVFRKTK